MMLGLLLSDHGCSKLLVAGYWLTILALLLIILLNPSRGNTDSDMVSHGFAKVIILVMASCICMITTSLCNCRHGRPSKCHYITFDLLRS
jgi:hypothetical protein